jgi:2-hydroxychromene-2-carboxylate isomerase
MFQNQQALDNENLKAYAQKVGLDGDELLKAVQTQKYQAQITASKEEGKRAGIEGTPSIYINGRPLVLQPAAPLLNHAIEDELEWKQNNGHWGAD